MVAGTATLQHLTAPDESGAFVFVSCAERADCPTLVASALQAIREDPDQYQVLCQTNKACMLMNMALQKIYNPDLFCKQLGEGSHTTAVLWDDQRRFVYRWKVGDPVINKRNIYQGDSAELLVANGETGTVVGIESRHEGSGRGFDVDTLVVRFEGGENLRFEPPTTAAEGVHPHTDIAPAYAITVHKSQGSEFDRVLLLLDSSTRAQSRSSLYTGITRARRRVVLVADQARLQAAWVHQEQRQTRLVQCLTSACQLPSCDQTKKYTSERYK